MNVQISQSESGSFYTPRNGHSEDGLNFRRVVNKMLVTVVLGNF